MIAVLRLDIVLNLQKRSLLYYVQSLLVKSVELAS